MFSDMWTWANYICSLWVSFLLCEMRVVTKTGYMICRTQCNIKIQGFFFKNWISRWWQQSIISNMQSHTKQRALWDCLVFPAMRLALVITLGLLLKPSRCVLCEILVKIAKCWAWRLKSFHFLASVGFLWTFLIFLTPQHSLLIPLSRLLIHCASHFHLAMGQGALRGSGSKEDHPFLGGSGPQLCSRPCPRARAVLLMQQPQKSQCSLATRLNQSCCWGNSGISIATRVQWVSPNCSWIYLVSIVERKWKLRRRGIYSLNLITCTKRGRSLGAGPLLNAYEWMVSPYT